MIRWKDRSPATPSNGSIKLLPASSTPVLAAAIWIKATKSKPCSMPLRAMLWNCTTRAQYQLQIRDGDKIIHDEHVVVHYVVLMTPGADRWVIRQLQAVPQF